MEDGMISVGIDVSKGKSTVCILKPYGEIVSSPFEVAHTEAGLKSLVEKLRGLGGKAKVIMEATGVYHLPVFSYLHDKGIFVAVINPLEMKRYANKGIRRVKTDKKDAVTIANYGIDNWFHLQQCKCSDETYTELKFLGRRYAHYMHLHVAALQELTHILDRTMPGIKKHLQSWNEASRKDKLGDFVEKYWHYDNITSKSQEEFSAEYMEWAKEKGYRQDTAKADAIYASAAAGITTLDSSTPSTKMSVQEAVRTLNTINNVLNEILTRMKDLAKTLPEYSVVRSMGGVGEVLAPKLIAEIGDVRRFHSGKALVAYAGIDAPPYQSGQFYGTNRKISKRGSCLLRKIGFETMRVLKSHKEPDDAAVYRFIIKKEAEGKPKKVAKIAGLNKFLHIYYARVMEVYKS